jgi:hypothetical protein
MKKILYSSLIIFTFIACGKKDDDPTPAIPVTPATQNATFSFLKDNHAWNYDYNALGNTGTIEMVTDSVGPNLYKISTVYDTDDAEYTYWSVSGPYLKGYQEGDPSSSPIIIYKFNPSLNDTWTNIDPSDKTSTYYKVTNADTTIVTSAGTFDHCKKIRVTFSYAFNTQYEYWNDTYGLVYQTGALKIELTSKNF